MTFRVQKRGVKNNWTVDGIYRSLSSAVLHCERAEGMSESGEEEMAFLIVTDGPDSRQIVMFIENGRLMHAGTGRSTRFP
jgi:hypothetical protein